MSDRNANFQSTGTKPKGHELPVYDRCSCEALLKPMS